jgi:hypothetical protein
MNIGESEAPLSMIAKTARCAVRNKSNNIHTNRSYHRPRRDKMDIISPALMT